MRPGLNKGRSAGASRIPDSVGEMIAQAEIAAASAEQKSVGKAPEFGSLSGDHAGQSTSSVSIVHDHEIEDADAIERINEEFAFVVIGGSQAVIWQDPSARAEDEVRLLKVNSFETLLGNRWHDYQDASGKTRRITWAKWWLGHPDRRTYQGVEFFPSATGKEGRPGWFNLWRGFAVDARRGGSYAVFLDHLQSNVCRGNPDHFRWLWAWFADLVQNPRRKPGTGIILRGGQGVGKSIVGEVFGRLIGQHWLIVDDARSFLGQFNVHLARALLLQADEAVWAGDRDAEGRLKGLITAERQKIEAKGVDPIWLPNYVRLLMTSNADFVAPAGRDERRYLVLDVDPRCQQHSEYFGEMLEELAAGGQEALLFDLLATDISGVNLRETPKTEALLEQKIHHLDPVESWLLDRLKDGAPTRSIDYWPEWIACDDLYDDYLGASDRKGVRLRSGQTAFGIKLRQLLPEVAKRKASTPSPDGAVMRRRNVYWLPPLSACREAFEISLKQPVEWVEDDD